MPELTKREHIALEVLKVRLTSLSPISSHESADTLAAYCNVIADAIIRSQPQNNAIDLIYYRDLFRSLRNLIKYDENLIKFCKSEGEPAMRTLLKVVQLCDHVMAGLNVLAETFPERIKEVKSDD